MVKGIAQRAIEQLIRKPKFLMPPVLALRSLTSKSGKGVYASSDRLFKGAVFGRDSLIVAEDLMTLRPQLVRRIILTMARLQGLTHRSDNEEEPGKIMHEYRTRIVDSKLLTGTPLEIFEDLSRRWGGDENTLLYYGSVDSTPYFVKILCDYCSLYGPRILWKEIIRKDQSKATVLDSMSDAIDWIVRKIEASKSGLLEYHAHSGEGLENQAWKDSEEFYVHENGRFVNHSRPIASIEVQGLAFDALMEASEYFPERLKELQKVAYRLRDKTIKLLWLPNRKYFALGLDYDKDAKTRIIKTTTANPASLLNSGLFDDLPENKRRMYLSQIVRNIMGTDFLTDAGVRSRALSEANLIPFWDYHGSYVSWPKETYDIAKGMRRQGFLQLQKELENRLINVVRKSRGYPEFLFVDLRGRILGASSNAHRHTHSLAIKSSNVPESVQAWTVSAVVSILADRRPGLKLGKIEQKDWQIDLEKEVLAHIPRVSALKWRALSARYPDYPYELRME